MPGGFGAGAGLDILASTWDTGMNLAANSILQSSAQNEAWKLYNYNNEYNKPLNQKKRFLEAGINPYAAMQQGQFTGGNSNSPAQTIEPPYGDYSPGLNGIVDRASQRELNAANARHLNAEAALRETDARTRSFENIARIDNLKKQGLISDAEYTRLMYENNSYGIRLEKQLRAQDDAHDLAELDKSVQEQVLKFLPQIKEAELQVLISRNKEIISALRNNDSDTALKLASKSVEDARKKGLDIDNEVAEKTKKELVTQAEETTRRLRNEADESGYKAQQEASKNRRGTILYHIAGDDQYDYGNPYSRSDSRYRNHSGGVR